MNKLSLIISVLVCAVIGSTLGHYLPAAPSDGRPARIADERPIPQLKESSALLADEATLADKATRENALHNELHSLAFIRELALWNPERAFAVAVQHQGKTR